MIKINLLHQQRRGPSVKIPFGWIFVVGYFLAACGMLYIANESKADDVSKLEQELVKAQEETKKVKRFSEQKTLKRKEKEKLVHEKQEYDRILAASGGGWTNTLLLFEDILRASKTVWLSDLRIEGDGRVQLTGKSKKNEKGKLYPGITDMLEAFHQKETQFKTVRLKRIAQEAQGESTEPTATFELVCVLTR